MIWKEVDDILCRIGDSDEMLTEEEVNAVARWLDDFLTKLSDNASKSRNDYIEVAGKPESLSEDERQDVEKKRNAYDSDMRQMEQFIKKFDDCIQWLNNRSVGKAQNL